jgi:hypothetical protein
MPKIQHSVRKKYTKRAKQKTQLERAGVKFSWATLKKSRFTQRLTIFENGQKHNNKTIIKHKNKLNLTYWHT